MIMFQLGSAPREPTTLFAAILVPIKLQPSLWYRTLDWYPSGFWNVLDIYFHTTRQGDFSGLATFLDRPPGPSPSFILERMN
jgi:hypothetical protein